MLVSIVSGSDKTVASVATGHQEFHPLYLGPGNVDNPTCQAHGIGLLPCAFLPIPKGTLFRSLSLPLVVDT
jgi:Plavaka transposase